MLLDFLYRTAAASWVLGTLWVTTTIFVIEISRIAEFGDLTLLALAGTSGLITVLAFLGVTVLIMRSSTSKNSQRKIFAIASIIVPVMLLVFVNLRYENPLINLVFLFYAVAPFGAIGAKGRRK